MTDTRVPAEVWPVATFLVEEMDARGWNPATVAERCGVPVGHVLSVLGGHPLTDDMADALAIGFGTSPDVWRTLDAAYWSALERELKAGAGLAAVIPPGAVVSSVEREAAIERLINEALFVYPEAVNHKMVEIIRKDEFRMTDSDPIPVPDPNDCPVCGNNSRYPCPCDDRLAEETQP